MERCAIGEERTRVSTRLCVYYNCTADYNFQANYKDCIVVANMLDICLLRTDQGGDPELVRESQRRRYADVGLVDKVIAYDEEWRQTRGALDLAKKDKNATQKKIGEFMKKKETPPAELAAEKKAHEAKIVELEAKEKELIETRDSTLGQIGNLVPDDVPVDDDEDNNLIESTWGDFEREDWMLSHYDLTQMAGIANTVKGAEVAGSRGYFLTGHGVLLNQALVSYAIHFLRKRGFNPLHTPFVMNKSMMAKVAQLGDFDEQLYKVSGGGEDQYLIATSEQPICAYHAGEWLTDKQLPIKYAGYSTCFRKEAGSHGRDQLGIFRVHQFEKIEQFVITSPENNESWDMQKQMIETSADFYKSLGIPYRVVNIVSGALNDAAAKKYDLEAWFPGSKARPPCGQLESGLWWCHSPAARPYRTGPPGAGLLHALGRRAEPAQVAMRGCGAAPSSACESSRFCTVYAPGAPRAGLVLQLHRLPVAAARGPPHPN